MSTAPCRHHDWHIHPHPETNGRALKICEVCPALKACAAEALHAGDSLDGSYQRPANDVVQGGVVCQGDYRDVAEQLAAVAGEPVPDYRDHRPRLHPPGECRGCGAPMRRRQRNPNMLPLFDVGAVEHMGHGYCTDCYMRQRRERHHGTKTAVDKTAVHDEHPVETLGSEIESYPRSA